jgi:ADP-ribosylglycohydrolase
MVRALLRVEDALSRSTPGAELAKELGGGTGAHEVVSMALYHLYGAEFGFRETIESGLNTFHPSGIDADSILGIAGAIAAMQHPEEVAGSEWLAGLRGADEIRSEAAALCESALDTL